MVRKVGMAALAACTISALATTMGWSADKPVFGLVMSFSGWFAPIDADTIAGAKLAVAEINAAGGVLGQPIEVVEFDNKSELPLGADGAVDVIGKGAKAILFPSDFDFGAPGAYVAQQKDVIAFSGASDPKFGVQGVGPFAYSTSNASQAHKQKGWKTAYVLLDSTIAYTKSLCASFATRWTELAGKDGLLSQDTFLNNDSSIIAQVTRITGLSKKPDLIFFCSYAPGGPRARAAGVTAAIATGESPGREGLLGKRAVNRVNVIDLATQFSVEHIVRDAADMGYRVGVFADCCAFGDLEAHRVSLRTLAMLADVVSSEAAFSE